MTDRNTKSLRVNHSKSDGFTLIELMIVVLILAILVGIAVAVYLSSRKKVSEETAKANERIGTNCIDKVWFKIVDAPFPAGGDANYRESYRDFWPPAPITSPYLPSGYPVNAYYMSLIERKIYWSYMPVSGGKLYVNNVYRNGIRIYGNFTVTTGQDWNKYLSGKIGIIPYRWTGAAWSNSYNRYITILTLDRVSNIAHYTTYFRGTVYRYGTFNWLEDGTGHP